MKIKVYIERTNSTKTVELKNNYKVIDLLKELKIDHTAVLVARSDSLITEDAQLKDNDNIKILSVISGG